MYNELISACNNLTYQAKYIFHILYMEKKEVKEALTHKPVQAIITDTSMNISIYLYSPSMLWKYLWFYADPALKHKFRAAVLWLFAKESSRANIIYKVSKAPTVFPAYGVENIWPSDKLPGETSTFMNNNCILKYFPSFQNPKPTNILITLHNPLKTFAK